MLYKKLTCLSLADFSSLAQSLRVKPEPTLVKHFSRTPGLDAYLRLGWNGQAGPGRARQGQAHKLSLHICKLQRKKFDNIYPVVKGYLTVLLS